MVPAPIDPTGGLASGLAAQAWQAAMLGLWNAGLWLLGLVLRLEDALLTPDLSGHGPAAGAYGLTLWMAAVLGTIMLLAQLLLTLLRRDARSLGAALTGCAKFAVVWTAWVGWAAAVIGVCGALTRAVLRSLLHVQSWSGWWPALHTSAIGAISQAVDVTVATVLGLLGLVLWLAALGHVFVMLGRAVTLLVLAATTPIAAAGLVGEIGRSWFWRSVRWFHAAALTPLLMALLLGIGVQTSAGVTAGMAAGPARAVATALPGVLLIVMSCFAPLALFRLLSFVDPNTPTGSSLRHLLASVLQTGLLLGGPGRWASLGAGSGEDLGDDQTGSSPAASPFGPPVAGSASDGRRGAAEGTLHDSGAPDALGTAVADGADPHNGLSGSALAALSPGAGVSAPFPGDDGASSNRLAPTPPDTSSVEPFAGGEAGAPKPAGPGRRSTTPAGVSDVRTGAAVGGGAGGAGVGKAAAVAADVPVVPL